MTVARAIALFFGAGLLAPGPGTWGSLAALPVFWALHRFGGFPAVAVATVVLLVVGWWAVTVEIAGRADTDPAEIVVDEVVGMWLALWPVSLGAAMMQVPVTALWPGWLAAFVAFRAFDILKPGPVGWADRQPGAVGVMLDDVVAGLLAALVVVLLAAISHGLLPR